MGSCCTKDDQTCLEYSDCTGASAGLTSRRSTVNTNARRMVECAVCQEVFTDPRMLPCQHTFCMECLLRMVQHQIGTNRFSCPECRADYHLTTVDILMLPNNRYVANLMEIVHDGGLDVTVGASSSTETVGHTTETGPSIRGGDRGARKLNTFTTKCSNDVMGMVYHLNHLFIVHSNDDKLYVYDQGRRFRRSVKISSSKHTCGMISPWGICLIRDDCDYYLLISDHSGGCLWWMSIKKVKNDVNIGNPHQKMLGYQPWGVSSVNTPDALSAAVAHRDGKHIYFYYMDYRLKLKKNQRLSDAKKIFYLSCKKRGSGIPPWQALSDHSGGYVVINQQLVWVDKHGNVTRHYNDQPAVRPSHIIDDGTDYLLSDPDNHCIHIVTNEGRHDGYLITGVDPTRVCLDPGGRRLWVAYKGKGKKVNVLEMSYTARPQPVI